MSTLDELITAAITLAGGEETCYANRVWRTEGGRHCPIGWNDCSQAVYVDLATGAHDYGEPGGPGHADCQRHCPHGHEPWVDPCPDPEPEEGAPDAAPVN